MGNTLCEAEKPIQKQEKNIQNNPYRYSRKQQQENQKYHISYENNIQLHDYKNDNLMNFNERGMSISSQQDQQQQWGIRNTFEGNIYDDDQGEGLINQQESNNINFRESAQYQSKEECIQIANKLIINGHILNMEYNLDKFSKQLKENNKDHQLEIYTKSYINQENNRIIILKGQFIIQSPIKNILKLLQDYEKVMELDKKIIQYTQTTIQGDNIIENQENEDYLLEDIDQTQIIYQKLQQLMFSVPREFSFVKKFKCMDKTHKIITEASQSVNYAEQPFNPENVRGNVVQFVKSYMPANYIFPDKFQDQNYTLIRFYKEIDFKANQELNLMKTGAASEIRNFVDRLSQYMLDQKQKQQNN